MYRKHARFALPASLRWITESIFGIGGAATVIAAWIDETAPFITDLIAIIVLPLVTSVVLLFNHLVFRQAQLRNPK